MIAKKTISPRDYSAHQIGKGSPLPEQLKTGIESLSGVSLDDVRVFHNSMTPVSLKTLGYTTGNDIHLAPGQEKHLPHEAWHVVQQRQGRVRNPDMDGEIAQQAVVAELNGDAPLTPEADVMGSKAMP